MIHRGGTPSPDVKANRYALADCAIMLGALVLAATIGGITAWLS